MSNEEESLKRIEQQIAELSAWVYELRHVVAAIANTSGQAEQIAAAVGVSKREEQLKRDQERAASIERMKALNKL